MIILRPFLTIHLNRVFTESGKSGKVREFKNWSEYQGKSENSMDAGEKSGSSISSYDKKENDSFWE